MVYRTMLLISSTFLVSACGEEGLNVNISAAQPVVEVPTSVVAGNADEENKLEGAWRVMYSTSAILNDYTVQNDDTVQPDCSEIFSFTDDYIWTRVGLNHISSGFYTLIRKPEEDSLGVFSLTATYSNGLTSCNQNIDISAGSYNTLYYGDSSSVLEMYSLNDDGALEQVGDFVYDEEVSSQLRDAASARDARTGDTGSGQPESVLEEVVGILRQAAENGQASELTNETQSETEVVEVNSPALSEVELAETAPPQAALPELESALSEIEYPEPAPIQTASPELTIPAMLGSSEGATTEPPALEPSVQAPVLIVDPDEPIAAPAKESNIKNFSITHVCESCALSEATISFSAETTDIEKLELFFLVGGTRESIAILDPISNAESITVYNSVEFSNQTAGCLEVVSTSNDNIETTSPQRCFTVY